MPSQKQSAPSPGGTELLLQNPTQLFGNPSVVLVVLVVVVVELVVVEVLGGVWPHGVAHTPASPQHVLIAQTWPGAQSVVAVHAVIV